MSILATGRLASVETIPPISPPSTRKRKRRRPVSSRQRPTKIHQPTQINLLWFRRGIDERNCALFEASLYPIKPELWSRTDQWLKKNHPSQARHINSLHIHMLVDDAIAIAFERSRLWNRDQPVSDRIMEYIVEAYAKFDPKVA